MIEIRSNNTNKGIQSPTSDELLLDSAFADDTGFYIDGIVSAKNVLGTFDTFGLASGSRVNREKTEGMWLGMYKNRTDKPIDIKWVRITKSLGFRFG